MRMWRGEGEEQEEGEEMRGRLTKRTKDNQIPNRLHVHACTVDVQRNCVYIRMYMQYLYPPSSPFYSKDVVYMYLSAQGGVLSGEGLADQLLLDEGHQRHLFTPPVQRDHRRRSHVGLGGREEEGRGGSEAGYN